MSQQIPDDIIEVDIDLDEPDATSAETKATYKKIADWVLDEYGLKVSNLYISQIKRKCGLDVGENYNNSKKADTFTTVSAVPDIVQVSYGKTF